MLIMQHITRAFLRTSLIVVLLAMALPLPQPIHAQDGEVTYDAPVEGSITANAFEQQWTLTTQGTDRIRVHVERTSGNLIPDVKIFDSNGNEVRRSSGAGLTHAVAQIDDIRLPSPGSFTILVLRDKGDAGATTGSYRLTVTPLGLGADHPNNAALTGPILFDTPVTGSIHATQWQANYTLDAEAGDAVALSARRVSGTLAPEVALFDNNGQELRRGYANDTDESAAFNPVDLPYTGQYTVIVQRTRGMDGDTTGDFELTAMLQGAGEDSVRLANVEPRILSQYNTPVMGEITNALWRQDWQFRTEAADTITIHVQRMPAYTPDTTNNLVPNVLLLDSNGDELRRTYISAAGDAATIEHFTVPEAGLYTIRVARDQNKDGPTTGTYELTVFLDGSGEGSPFLADTEGVVDVGTPVTGSLTNARWMHVYTFSGEEGQEFTFTATRTDGTLVPNLDIRDSNGQSLRYRYPAPTLDQAITEGFRLPYSGEYQIVVLRDRHQDGVTTGCYELLIAPIVE